MIHHKWHIVMLHCDLKIPTIKETIKEFYQRYRDRLEQHPNNLDSNLMKERRIVEKAQEKDIDIY